MFRFCPDNDARVHTPADALSLDLQESRNFGLTVATKVLDLTPAKPAVFWMGGRVRENTECPAGHSSAIPCRYKPCIINYIAMAAGLPSMTA
jgi:hypothetical protein